MAWTKKHLELRKAKYAAKLAAKHALLKQAPLVKVKLWKDRIAPVMDLTSPYTVTRLLEGIASTEETK